MKTILSAVLLTMFGTTALIGQVNVNDPELPNAILCNAVKPGDTLTYKELIKCDELTQPINGVKVKSFKIGFAVTEGSGAKFHEYNNTGGKLSLEIKDALKTLESKGVKKLLIENVVVLTPNGDIRNMKGINICLIK